MNIGDIQAPEKYELKRLDVLRFGRTSILVRDIGYSKESKEISRPEPCYSNQADASFIQFTEKTEEEYDYRTESQKINAGRGICLSSQDNLDTLKTHFGAENEWYCRFCCNVNPETLEEDPLIRLCLCTDGQEFYHYKCLKNYLSSHRT